MHQIRIMPGKACPLGPLNEQNRQETMSVRTIATALAILAASSGLASAQAPKATRPGQAAGPGAGSRGSRPHPHPAVPGMGRLFLQVGRQRRRATCFRCRPPKEPASVDHGDNFFIVSQRPARTSPTSRRRWSVIALQPNSKVDVVDRQEELRDVHQGQGSLGRERRRGAGARRGDEDGSQHERQRRFRPRHQDLLHLFAAGHFGGAEADRNLQSKRLASRTFRKAGLVTGLFAFLEE